MKPYVMKETLSSGEYTVAVTSVLAFGADAAGKENASPAFQAAIEAAKEAGGGVVEVPAGSYRLEDPLTVRTGVTLRGEWISPEKEPCSARGTVLLCYAGREDAEGTPQVTMEACTGIRYMTFFYPEQDFANPVPYAPTVRQHGSDSMTLENVTLVNPWLGVQCGSDANELHFLHNVYMTPLHTGFFMDMTTDIGRMQNLHLAPDYLHTYAGIPLEDIRQYMLRNVTGVCMGRSDWEYGYDIYASYCRTGFMITSFKDSGPNTQLSGLHLHNCDIGFRLVNVNPYGVALSDSEITADMEGLEAAIMTETRFQTVMQLNNVDLCGPFRNIVLHNGAGQLSFVNCTLSGWTNSAAVQNGGGLTFEQCTFEGGKTHMQLHSDIGGTQVLGCTFGGQPRIVCDPQAKPQLLFSEEALHLSKAPRGGHKPYPYAAQPSSDALYVVTDFGAAADGKTDDTEAFRKALAEAGKTGGIVYVPGGWYRLDGTLTVPTGVELRGVFDVPCHTMGGGSVLLTYAGRDDENGTPFISLEEKSGVRGIVIDHPEQETHQPHPYPWAIRSLGRFCYVVNTVFVNAWLGCDFATYPSEGHYISYISGAPIRCGLYVGNSDGEGWVENIQYNPHYLFRSHLPNTPCGGEDWHDFWHNQIKYLEAIKFGYTANEHLLGTFVFAALHGLMFVTQDGRGASGTFIGHGTDGGENGLYIEGIGNADLINTELVTIESPHTRVYMLTAENAVGTARLYNTLMWGAPDYAVVIHGGTVEMQQTNFVHAGKKAITVHGGEASFPASFFYTDKNHVVSDGGICTVQGSMCPRNVRVHTDDMTDLCIENNGGTVQAAHSWSFWHPRAGKIK